MFPTRVATAMVVIKPDAIERSLDLRIRHIIGSRRGMTVKLVAERLLHTEEVQFLHRHILRQPDYPAIEAFMTKNPVQILSVIGPDAPDRLESLKGVIRKQYQSKTLAFPEFPSIAQNLLETSAHPVELLVFLRSTE